MECFPSSQGHKPVSGGLYPGGQRERFQDHLGGRSGGAPPHELGYRPYTVSGQVIYRGYGTFLQRFREPEFHASLEQCGHACQRELPDYLPRDHKVRDVPPQVKPYPLAGCQRALQGKSRFCGCGCELVEEPAVTNRRFRVHSGPPGRLRGRIRPWQGRWNHMASSPTP